VHPAFPAERVLLALSALDSVVSLRDLVAGNGNFADVAPVAALPVGDNDSLNIVAGRQASVLAAVQTGDPIYPSHVCVVPNRAPNDSPSVAVHLVANR
jgi:hypothetical protein